MKQGNKSKAAKTVSERIWSDGSLWTVHYGHLQRGRGRPTSIEALFRVIGEKLPFECLDKVRRALAEKELPSNGVYVAHDSMGYARYVGRGNIFARLKAQRKSRRAELQYFSFYVVADKKHEREIETILIRAAGPQLQFNNRKRRIDIQPGDIRDFEAGTKFFIRQGKRGRPTSTATA